MPADAALTTEGLSKSYPYGHIFRRRRAALRGLDLRVERGEIFGCLGPNGSGKTTTLKLLMGLIHADAGSASILGRPLQDPAWRRQVGYLPEHPYFYDYLTAREYIEYVGRLFGLDRATRSERQERLLRQVGLARSADVPLRRYSKGMLQRLGLAQALVNDPELVLLDEPMSGLDPVGRRLVRDLILDLRRRGKTVFFSTHILSDAETLCDRVAVLREGRLLKAGLLSEILDLDVAHVEVLVSAVPEEALPAGLGPVERLGERLRVRLTEDRLPAALEAVRAAGGRVLAVQPVRQSLEEFFFRELGTPGKEESWTVED
jgi:ABC-2 type transport system ATP-binding protein